MKNSFTAEQTHLLFKSSLFLNDYLRLLINDMRGSNNYKQELSETIDEIAELMIDR